MTNFAQLYRILTEKGLTEKEMGLVTKILQDEYDFGWRCAEAHHNIPTQREYGTGHAKIV